jgi:integrase
MPRIALTDRFCARVQPAADRVDYFDEATPGLALRVSAADVRTWTFSFTSPRDNRRARITLGRYPTVSLAGARGLALEAAGCLTDGKDPRDVKAAKAASVMTVAMLAESYLDLHVRPNLRTASNFEQRIRKNVLPVIGSVNIADLHSRHINQVTDPIVARGRLTEANRVFQGVRAMLLWAVARGDLDKSPLAGKLKPAKETGARDRTLDDAEIAHAWNMLPEALSQSVACQRILKLALILGQRSGEIAGMAREELDLDGASWLIPPERTKNGAPHAVPLPDIAIEIIEAAIRDAGKNCPYVFPSQDKDGALSCLDSHAVATTLRRAHTATKAHPKGRFNMKAWKAHDLRRTALTGLAKLNVQPVVIGAVANHLSVTQGGVTFAHYVKHDYAKEKRDALDLWAAKLKAIIEGTNNVVPMSRRA